MTAGRTREATAELRRIDAALTRLAVQRGPDARGVYHRPRRGDCAEADRWYAARDRAIRAAAAAGVGVGYIAVVAVMGEAAVADVLTGGRR